MARFRVATFNLYQYAEPGTWFYERTDANTYTPDEWAAKKAWIATQVAQMDADVIGFQEVFSWQDLQAFTTCLGYPFFAVAEEAPATLAGDDKVFVGPRLAIAARQPFDWTPLVPPQAVADGTRVEDGFRMARTTMVATTQVAGLGQVTMVLLHLKSRGAFVDKAPIDAIPDPDAKLHAFNTAFSLRMADQAILRHAEAAAVYRFMIDRVRADPDHVGIVLGDLNDEPDSWTLQALSATPDPVREGAPRRPWMVGSTPYHDLPDAAQQAYHRFRLQDAVHLLPAEPNVPRPITYATEDGSGRPDAVLVTQALAPRNANAVWTVQEHRVLNEHLVGKPQPKKLTSDHAPVVVTIAPRAG